MRSGIFVIAVAVARRVVADIKWPVVEFLRFSCSCSKSAQAARGTARIDQCLRDHRFENIRADVMRTGKSGEQSVRREQLKSADVQFLVAAHGIVQAAFAFGKGRRVEDDELETFCRFFGAAQELENILLDPSHG